MYIDFPGGSLQRTGEWMSAMFLGSMEMHQVHIQMYICIYTYMYIYIYVYVYVYMKA